MELMKFYIKASDIAEQIKQDKPAFADRYAAFILNDRDEIFMGLSSLVLKDGKLINLPADVAAAMNMANAGCRNASALVIISPKNGSVLKPSEEGLGLLFRYNPNNDKCQIYLSNEDQPTVATLRLAGSAASLMEGFDFGGGPSKPSTLKPVTPPPAASAAPAPSAAPKASAQEVKKDVANAIKGVGIDESNPFYEAPEDIKPPEEIIAMQSEEEEAKAAAKKKLQEEENLTPEELLEQAKRRKKVARSNFLFRRKH